MEDEAHCLDFQIAPQSTSAQQEFRAIGEYAKALTNLRQSEDEKARIEEQIEVAEQVLTITAVNTSSTFTTTPQLLAATVQEVARLKEQITAVVRTPYLLVTRVLILI